jgi:hypothetical protein
MLRRSILLPLFGLLAGCAMMELNPHSRVIKAVDSSLIEIRSLAATQLPTGQRSISSNGREMLSGYFIVEGGRFKPAKESANRYYVQFIILGDRRPYDVSVLVTHERRTVRGEEPTFVVVGYDDRLTQEIESKLRRELTKRREERNIIDDFRVY